MVERASIASQAQVEKEIKIKVDVDLAALRMEIVPTDKLRPNGYNPNKQDEHEFELLLQSMREDGFTQPILTTMELMIIDGEHRWRAAQALKMRRVPVVRLDLDETQARISTIRHNRARGTHDADLEAMVLKDLEKLGGVALIQKSLLIPEGEIRELLDFQDAPTAMAGEDYNTAWLPVNAKNKCTLDAQGNPVNFPAFEARVTLDNATVMTSRTNMANQLAAGRLKTGQVAGGIIPVQVNAIFDGDNAERVRHALTDLDIPGETPADKFLFIVNQMEANHG